jgi:site-specific recombinase XerD
MRKPFFWKARGAWYVKVGNSQVLLDADEAKAYAIWQEMQQGAQSGTRTLVWPVAQDFLRWAQKHVADSTFALYTRYVVLFANEFGTHRVTNLRPIDLTRWLDAQAWKAPSRRQAIISIKRCFSWGAEQGLIGGNPFATVKAPRGKRRDTLIAGDSHARIAAKGDGGRRKRDGAWRALVVALRHSGARPGTVASVTAANVSPSLDAWVMPEHKTRDKTRAPLVVWLTPCLQTLTRILVAARPNGPLFLNSNGEPWTRNAMRCRMRRLRKGLNLPAGTNAYAYRHTFTTDALLNGTPMATVAELLGHSDVRMLAQHYAHLDQHAEHLRQAAANALRRKA